MRKQKRNIVRVIMLLVLCCTVIAGNLFLPGTTAEAAAKKPSIAKQLTIPVGKLDSKICWNIGSIDLSTAEKLSVNNKTKGATYTFASSDSKVVSVNKDGGYVTGLKAGSATITCTQTYKGKKTTVGKCKVTVKNAALKVSDYENEFAVGSGGYNLYTFYACVDPLFHIEYRNPNATYTLTSDSKDFTIKEIKCDASTAKDATDWEDFVPELKSYIGDRYFYGYSYTAKKAGTYTVTVKETYNKSTKTLGSFQVVIKDTCLAEDNIDILLNNYLNAFTLLEYTKADMSYYFSIEDFDESNLENNVLLIYSNGNDVSLYGNKTGTAKVSVREESETGALIGTVTITVKENPCEEILLDEKEYTTYVDDYININFDLEPWDTTDKVTITSDNPKVLNVEYDEDEMTWNYTALKAGTANVTIQCGSQSVVCKVTVEEW